MPLPQVPDLTIALADWQKTGNPASGDAALKHLYPYLLGVAHNIIRDSRIIGPSTGVQEAYLKLRGWKTPWSDRIHFVRVAAKLMRQALASAVEAATAQKRGGGATNLPLSLVDAGGQHFNVANPADFLDLHQALNDLDEFNELWANIIDLQFFGGLTQAEIAESLDMTPDAVQHQGRKARLWLRQKMGKLS